MFKSTNHFFEKVYQDKVTKIEESNYIDLITNNHDLGKLKTFSFDLLIFISNKEDVLLSEIDEKQLENKIDWYKKNDLEIPYKKVLNTEYFIAKSKNLSIEGIPQKNDEIDVLELFFSVNLFRIRSLKYQVNKLIKEQLEKKREPELIDLSDTSAVEKIIYLNELGIIDYLRNNTTTGISNNSLASVLSGITGIKPKTISPSLNRLTKKDVEDNKHPYYKSETVQKVKTFLTKLGFNQI
jgi:hypothetical protein